MNEQHIIDAIRKVGTMKHLIVLAVLSLSAIALGQEPAVHVMDKPDFQREYRAHVGINGIVLIVHAGRLLWGDDRGLTGELVQADGKWVLFDIDNPADKILDHDLVPPIIALCRKIKAMDRKFMADGPKEVTDRYGHKWVRVN